MYFGSCYFGNPGASDFILSANGHLTQKLLWVAGYNKRVNWVEAAIVEMFFWDQFQYINGAPVERVITVGDRIKEFMPGAINQLGLGIFVRRKGRTGGITNILAERLGADEIAT